VDLEVVAIKGLLILALLAGGWLGSARVTALEPVAGAPEEKPKGIPAAPEGIYASYSNEALTALAAQWDTLDVHQRRALLTEVRHRMRQNGSRPGTQVIQIRTERRFGRIIRQPDGRVIRIETQVVQVRPVPESALPGGAGGYGVGFERRVRSTEPQPPAATAPEVPAVAPVAAPVRPPSEAAKPLAAPALQPLH
jgi:hypothetical protein